MFLLVLVKYVMSRRGKCLLNVDGFTFCIKTVSGVQTRWVCSTHNNKKCHAEAYTVDDEIIKINNIHNHDKVLH